MAMAGGQEGGGGALRKECGGFPEQFLFYKVKIPPNTWDFTI